LLPAQMRPEVLAAAAAVNEALSRVPVLEWFVRGPDGRPVGGSRRRPRGALERRGGLIPGR
jgi:hypothetical protein